MHIFTFLCLGFHILRAQADVLKFPDDFKFGICSAAYQVEGAWNESGKGENIWDRMTHTRPDFIINNTNADIASDSYHKLNEDLENLRWMGVNHYRFSLSWSRLLPSGYNNKINKDGVRYYNQLIDGLIARNITPMVTMFHWDLPQPLQEIGGWPNSMLVNYFADYARVVFTLFGDRVKLWITFNEPKPLCVKSYGDASMAPGYMSDGIGTYLCGRTMLISHARVYRIYDKEFRATQKGKVGITLDSLWYEPATNSTEDKQAANRAMQFYFGWFAHPIYSKNGDYPAIMKTRIAAASKEENFTRSRLIPLTRREVNFIRGACDFLGVNYYSTRFASANTSNITWVVPSNTKDTNVKLDFPNVPLSGSPWILDTPWGFRKLLNWIKKNYNNPLVYITENGSADFDDHHDSLRIKYFQGHLQALQEAILIDKCNVKAYTVWSFIDSFEWHSGYTARLGLIHVDFTSPNRTRTKKDSAYYYKCVIKYKTSLCPDKNK